MGCSRLLISALFVSLCAAPGRSQDGFSPSPVLKGQVPVYRMHSRTELPFMQGGVATEPMQVSPDLLGQAAANRSWTVLTGKLTAPPLLSQRCYTLREYQFEQEDPRSDVTRLKNYSVCQPSGRVRLKVAIISPSR
jgi:hypothetical protein